MSDEANPRSILLGLGLIVALGVAVGWAAFRGHTRRAISVEGRQQAVSLAQGIASCASGAGSGERPRGLPPTAEPVPASPASVAARRHATTPADWAAPAYSCAGFAPASPQLFRLRWERLDDSHGVVHAEADLDGDLRPDIAIAQPVSCSSAAAPPCSLGPLSSISR